MIAQLDSNYVKLRPHKAVTRVFSHLLFEGRPLTTKARWLNHITMPLLRAVQMLPLGETKDPIFILGTGRSGTTLLGTLLSIHPQIGFLNEPKILWHIAYPDEDLIGSYSRGLADYALAADQATEDVCNRIHHLYSAYRRLTGVQRVLDKYPEMVFRIAFLQKVFSDAEYLVLIRNGLDTIQSIDTWSKHSGQSKQGVTQDWWGLNGRKWHLLVQQVVPHEPLLSPYAAEIATFTRHVDMAAVEWILSMRAGLRLLAQLPQRTLRVNYEELVASPEETLLAIMEFCGLAHDPLSIEYARATVRSQRAKLAVELHPCIRDAFEDTQQELGYQN